MAAREMNNLDGLLGPDEQNAAARRGYSRAAAAARRARGTGGGPGAAAGGEDSAEARQMAILKHERRRMAALSQKPDHNLQAAPSASTDRTPSPKPFWLRILDRLRRR